MAGFTSGWCPIRPHLRHAFFELPFVRVVVATGAIQIAPVIDGGGLGLEFRGLLVAVGARRRQVTSSQRKVRFLVPRQGKRGRLIGLESVAAVAGVEIGSGCELPGMTIARGSQCSART